MQACHPLTTELRRWEKLAKVTERGEINEDVQSSMAASRKLCQAGVRPKPVFAGGLVNFPKYMLINNCHLKQMDLQRYADQCAEEVKPDLPMAQVSLARRGEASPSSSALRMDKDNDGESFALVEFKERGSAQVVKRQEKYLVEERVLVFTEAKTMVDTTTFAEQSVQFNQPAFDPTTMKVVLAYQPVPENAGPKCGASEGGPRPDTQE
eukprot:g2450.t1